MNTSEWHFYVLVATVAAVFLGVWIWALVRSKPERTRR